MKIVYLNLVLNLEYFYFLVLYTSTLLHIVLQLAFLPLLIVHYLLN